MKIILKNNQGDEKFFMSLFVIECDGWLHGKKSLLISTPRP